MDDTETITRIIRGRRSLKPALMDAGRELPRPLLDLLFENANWAPTHGYTEPWRFKVFAGEARQTLASRLAEIYREVTPEAEFRQDKFDKLSRNPTLAGAVVALIMRRGDNPKIPELEEIEAVACAVQNMHLTAAAAGLGAFWSSPPLLDSGAAKRWLGLRDRDRCLGLFYLGWPREGEAWPKGVRKPVEEKVEWV